MLDRTAQRRERPFVADVLEAEVAVEPVEQVGGAFGGAADLHQQALAVVGRREEHAGAVCVVGRGLELDGDEPVGGEGGGDRRPGRVLIGTAEGEQDRGADRRAEREREEDLAGQLLGEEQAEHDVERRA